MRFYKYGERKERKVKWVFLTLERTGGRLEKSRYIELCRREVGVDKYTERE